MATVDNRTGRVMRGDELDDNYSRCILPRVMKDILGDPHRSAWSPKHKVQHVIGVPNVGKLDTQGGHVVILMLILIPIMKGMS